MRTGCGCSSHDTRSRLDGTGSARMSPSKFLLVIPRRRRTASTCQRVCGSAPPRRRATPNPRPVSLRFPERGPSSRGRRETGNGKCLRPRSSGEQVCRPSSGASRCASRKVPSMVTIQIPPSVYDDMRQHLLPRRSRDEQAGFVYAKPCQEQGASLNFEHVRWEPLGRDDFDHQSAFHLELRDETKARVIKQAHDLDCSLIEFHSHPGPWLAQFSGSDFAGFEEFVPHILWRLKGRPYAAAVMAPSGVDALAWTSASDVLAVDSIVLGNERLRLTGLSMEA